MPSASADSGRAGVLALWPIRLPQAAARRRPRTASLLCTGRDVLAYGVLACGGCAACG